MMQLEINFDELPKFGLYDDFGTLIASYKYWLDAYNAVREKAWELQLPLDTFAIREL